ncbi:related to DNA Polymerase iota (POLI) [Sporisorium reilianum f. sp. reilianum]|uniref:Related to DNA Polymerase iota (POLI) n=1 Tax=Sporisorium reilianum f. sp. reilianum TaxID=72559 RepID=A0A2N8U9H9_9BASI|nr:related to DNA Polymerase iota (POLI) [Sporisorium reilianum f. sp. reilianum]
MTGRSPATSPSKSKLAKSDNNGSFWTAAHDGSPSRLAKRQRRSPRPTNNASELPAFASRVIIALDLDAFYVLACRKRDPSFIGIPIGIQQKALVATISYEARAAGVAKLDSIKDALKKCPDMVLVNGEDLTYFRQVSSQVWRLVRSIVWEKRVEKLGMDELFCDVTEMVDHHLSTLRNSTQVGTERWFDLNAPGASEKVDGYGFAYQAWPADPPGHLDPSEAAEHLQQNQPDWWQQRMLAAARLAYYLRQRIADEVGLTCSAGIAPGKSLAKLVGALNKPNQQTTFCPPIASLASGVHSGARSIEANLLRHINAFLDPQDLRKLPGFGRVVVDKIRDHLHPDPNTNAKNNGGRARSNFMEPTSISDDEEEKAKVKVTVGSARRMLSLDDMNGLFGEVIGPRLWSLVSGRDAEPVVPAPEFPLQLSIEDTYPYPSLRGASIHTEIGRLSMSLLRRLELELTTQGNAPQELPKPLSQEAFIKNESVTIRDYKEQPPSPVALGKGGWLRYPMKLRLSVRQGWNNRVSKQTKMPVEIFELDQPREARAAAIAKACRGLLRALIGGDDVVGDGMNLIIIAALELSDKWPQRALGSFFAAGSTSAEVKAGGNEVNGATEIDAAFLASLPRELREEIANEYGIDLATSKSVDGVIEGNRDDKGKDKAVPIAGLSCSICGEEMEVWMQHDHELYPLSGLPSHASASPSPSHSPAMPEGLAEEESTGEELDDLDEEAVRCERCGETLKPFMLTAHQRFHEMQHES